jgi:hypothetical protein
VADCDLAENGLTGQACEPASACDVDRIAGYAGGHDDARSPVPSRIYR